MSALDGLRGVAAFMVMLMHCMLLVPSALNAFEGVGSQTGVLWLVAFTPLHVFWAGTEAVFIFFVLSGFVLTRAAESGRFSWRAYYPSRLLRLYLPVAGALGFAAAAIAIVPRSQPSGASWWLLTQEDVTLGVHYFFHSLLLVRGAGILPVLWSLKWEVIFSLLLPVAVLGASRRWPVGVAQGAILLGVMLLGSDSQGNQKNYFLYLPMFGIGVVMAHQHHLLATIGRKLTTTTGAFTFAVGLILLTMSWTARDQATEVYKPIAVVGAALIVFAFGYWKPLRSVGETRPLQWLGRRSFSLYLVHYPIVVSTAFLLGSLSRFAFVIAIPLSLLGAHLFFRLVEGPSHRLSQSVRRLLAASGRQLDPAPVTQATPRVG
jgi:peptidoglycan/LPS O-acetylase OafA/YrhL